MPCSRLRLASSPNTSCGGRAATSTGQRQPSNPMPRTLKYIGLKVLPYRPSNRRNASRSMFANRPEPRAATYLTSMCLLVMPKTLKHACITQVALSATCLELRLLGSCWLVGTHRRSLEHSTPKPPRPDSTIFRARRTTSTKFTPDPIAETRSSTQGSSGKLSKRGFFGLSQEAWAHNKTR